MELASVGNFSKGGPLLAKVLKLGSWVELEDLKLV